MGFTAWATGHLISQSTALVLLKPEGINERPEACTRVTGQRRVTYLSVVSPEDLGRLHRVSSEDGVSIVHFA